MGQKYFSTRKNTLILPTGMLADYISLDYRQLPISFSDIAFSGCSVYFVFTAPPQFIE